MFNIDKMVYLSTEDMKIRMEIIVTYEELLTLGQSYVGDLQPRQRVRISIFRCLSVISVNSQVFLFLKECSLSYETPTSSRDQSEICR